MKKSSLRRVVAGLRDSLSELDGNDNENCRLRSAYSEYLVAYELAKQGYEVQIGNERDITSADIYLPEEGKRIEVKSGKYDREGWTDASFGDGNQINDKRFDYCVFVTFDYSTEGKVKEMMVFSRKELRSVGNNIRRVAKFKSNSHLLIKGPDYREYIDYMKEKSDKRLTIEKKLHRNIQDYNRAWEKIEED